ncbi:MAG: site-specific integrase, partial [Anaerolineae bacterium]|nr:site-specific integrase [Anaerolineae bacterium]
KSSIRSIKLGKDSTEVLQTHKRLQNKERESMNKRWSDSNHVFVSSIGSPIDPTNLLRTFRQLLKEAGLPKMRFHDLRHTAASIMLNNGIDVLVASQRLGHARPSITLDVYGHLMPAIQNEAAEVLDSILAGG